MKKAYLLLGGNLGDVTKTFESAAYYIEQACGEIIKVSSIYETAPWGFEADTAFLNQGLLIDTPLSAQELLECCLAIETKLGRTRSEEGYSSRTLDIDILFFGDEIINESNLTVPHPRFQDRLFAIIPMMEMTPDYIHPILKKSMQQLKKECKDTGKIAFHTDKIILPYYV